MRRLHEHKQVRDWPVQQGTTFNDLLCISDAGGFGMATDILLQT